MIRGLRRRLPAVDVIRVQEAALGGVPDESVLAWAAEEGRVLLTHDASTMTAAAYARISAGEPSPGVIVIPQWLSAGDALEDLLFDSGMQQFGGLGWASPISTSQVARAAELGVEYPQGKRMARDDVTEHLHEVSELTLQ